MKDQETKSKFVELRAKGWSFDRIANELNVSKPTLIHWGKELELDIRNLKAIELESLQERFYMRKVQRIELFGEKLQAIRSELDKRDLTDLSTEKLFDLLIKYTNVLNSEATETVFRGTDPRAFDNIGNDVTWKP